MQLLQALNWRYAVREFSPERIPETRLNTLLEATRLSASSYGLQPYKLCIVRSEALREKLLPYSYGQDKVVNSSHLIVFAAETRIDEEIVERYVRLLCQQRQQSRNELDAYAQHMKSAIVAKTPKARKQWAHEQAYLALGNFLTSAALLEIDACPMTGFDHQGFNEVLGLNERGLESVAIAALGQRADTDQSAKQTKIRCPRSEFIIDLLS